MALVNCPECGKEISNTVKKCPYCGFKIKKTSKLIPIGIGAVMCCSVIVGAIVYYRATNLQIDSSQNAAMIAVECVKDTLLNPDSIIVYDCNVSHYDVAFDGLIYRLEEIPEYATENGYNVYLHIGSQNRSGGISEEEYAIILSEDGALINFSDSDDGLAFQTNDLAWIKYSNSEIKDILALMDTKKRIHVKKSEKKHTASEIDEAVDVYVQGFLTNNDFEAGYEYAERAANPEEKKKIVDDYINNLGQEKLDAGQFSAAITYFEMTVNTEKIAECNQRIYQNAVEKLDEGKYCEAKRIFETLGDYSDSETMVQECDYRYGNELLTGLKYDLAYTVLEGISGYQDSATIIENSKSDRYDDAIASMDAGDYTDAVETFTALKDYSDSKNKITTCKYRIAMGYMETGEYAEAKTVLEDISDYENSSDLILECIYQIGITELENGEYDQAYADFESISEYNDSSVKMLEVKYQNAISLIVSEEYEDAISLFSEITYYKDSAKKITDVQKTIYEDAKTFMDEKDYKKALALFEYLDEYGDSKDMVYEAKYMIGVSYISEKNFDKAFAILEELDDKRAKSFQSELSATGSVK